MAPQTLAAVMPLSDEEFDRLAGFLEQHSTLDMTSLLGLLHAVAVAPSLLPLSVWLPAVLPNGLGTSERTEVEELLVLLLRLHEDVLKALQKGQAMLPDPEDRADCKAFAFGYAAGAELDPEWAGDAARWSFACPMAYLGDRRELLDPQTIADIESNLAPDPELLICRHLGALLRSTEESFREARKAESAQQSSQPSVRRVGRNDPCPCGSGKKFKRCCIDRAPRADAV